jgi:hypothetical protein
LAAAAALAAFEPGTGDRRRRLVLVMMMARSSYKK